MSSFIDIVRQPYEEPHHLNLVVTAANGSQQGRLEIYSNAADLSVFAKKIREVPHPRTEALWELGSAQPERRFAFYFRLRGYQIASSGQCAIEVRFNNNGTLPHREVMEFRFQLCRPIWIDLQIFSRHLAV